MNNAKAVYLAIAILTAIGYWTTFTDIANTYERAVHFEITGEDLG